MKNFKNESNTNEEKYYELKIEGPIHLTIDREYSSKFNSVDEWKDSFNIIVTNSISTFLFSKNDIEILNIEGFDETTNREITLTANLLIEQGFSSLEDFNADNIELNIDSNYSFDISELSVEVFN